MEFAGNVQLESKRSDCIEIFQSGEFCLTYLKEIGLALIKPDLSECMSHYKVARIYHISDEPRKILQIAIPI